jgi:AcrR family transcriptional regulator
MDRRTIKTQKLIKTIFITLLKEKTMSKITVSEIARLANIGRGTFYTHYTDIYDLRSQIFLDTMKDIIEVFDTTYPVSNEYTFKSFTSSIVEYVINNRETFLLLFFSDAAEKSFLEEFKQLLVKRVLEAEGLQSENLKDRTEISFAISGIIGVLSDWLVHESEMDIKEMIDILDTIMTEY